ncbi:hypothetical protein SAMN02745823_01431 [Sporobacter termitidis DSM 10068]|uniref:Uncharacterized protein n=1 Tax=Sporobacter termitidis DSM 10068 TaxID=1123282 RepID=A0A1M5WXN6_9FIRM|nr:ATP-binding protein [Sporobacter termitidis]SHH91924.1 hypothetical protein SAMN02745823_01431 [Sporobacter termitidis DSM 10068]
MDTIFKRLTFSLDTLTVFRPVMDSSVLSSFYRLCRAASDGDVTEASCRYAGVYYRLREAGFAGVGEYVLDVLKYSELPFAKAMATGAAEASYLAAAERDVRILSEAACLSCEDIKRQLMHLPGGYNDIIGTLPEWETGVSLSFDALKSFYRQNGSGPLAKYRAFLWSGDKMTPVASPDPVRFDRLVGYDWQRQAVLENTRALLAGRFVNNILLYGDSGTGKSATVKSMLNVTEFSSLTLIEVPKQSLTGLPDLLSELAWRPRKFIIFIDDLSFEDGDAKFSALKVILEGSLGRRPPNVAVYVTSNRRQLVRRNFSDRDEMNNEETVEEKTSLSDRFGLRIPFFSLNQEDYLKTAETLARQAGVAMDDAALHRAALQWAIEHGARTPRTARQFADDLAAKQPG